MCGEGSSEIADWSRHGYYRKQLRKVLFSIIFILEFVTELQIIAARKNGLGIHD